MARLQHDPRGVDTLKHSPRPDSDKETKSNFSKETVPDRGHGEYSLEELAPNPADSKAKLFRNNQILVKKFQALDGNYKKLTARYMKTRKDITEKDAAITSLQQDVASLESRLEQQLIGVVHSPRVSPTMPTRRPRASSHGPPSSSAGHDPAAALSFSSDPGLGLAGEEAEPGLPPLPPPQRQPPADPASDIFNRSTSPASEHDAAGATEVLPIQATIHGSVRIKAEPSSDPVIVSERQVRKRKTPHDAEESPERRRPVKPEESDSLPLQNLASANLLLEESMDLDEVGPRLSTPRKLRLWRDGFEGVPPTATLLLNASETATSRLRTPATVETRRAIESSALTPINVNIRISKPNKVAKSVNKRPRKSGLGEGIGSLAEDGNLYQRAVRRKTNNALLETPVGEGRLNRLLNARAPEEEPAIIRSAPGLRNANRFDTHELIPQRRVLPFGENRRDKAAAAEETPSRPSKQAGKEDTATHVERHLQKRVPDGAERDTRKGREIRGSLRSKDPSTLKLADFKVNPKVNDGSDFAYSEVVRGKENRACLSGCSDENCCGPMFRQLAVIESRKRQPSEDLALFEDYLGDSISRIWGMSKEEKDELWIEAKAWQLANTQGKHRHRHARRPSPPGFWNPDFPSTQEIEEEKAEAARREKQMVQERYREAMRPEGRWIFRDE